MVEFNIRQTWKHTTRIKKLPTTGGLAQAGQWLARKFVRIWKFCARPNGSESPACAKPLGRYMQAGDDSAADNKVKNRTLRHHDKE